MAEALAEGGCRQRKALIRPEKGKRRGARREGVRAKGWEGGWCVGGRPPASRKIKLHLRVNCIRE